MRKLMSAEAVLCLLIIGGAFLASQDHPGPVILGFLPGLPSLPAMRTDLSPLTGLFVVAGSLLALAVLPGFAIVVFATYRLKMPPHKSAGHGGSTNSLARASDRVPRFRLGYGSRL